jgi:hypothetical protein
MMNNQRQQYFWMIFVLGLLLGGFSGTAAALSGELHWLEVHVLDKQSGDAVSGAAVCLGTTARPDQFGAVRTDERGVVRFNELLPNPLLLTVSRLGYQGQKQLLEPIYQNRVLVMKVASGGGGPHCDAPAGPVTKGAVSTALVIERVTVEADSTAGDSGNVLVSVSVSGQANQMRVSEQADFSGASWQNFRPSVAHTLSEGKGLKQIYVQVRRVAEVKGASIEVLSPTEKVQYRLR